MSEKGFVVNEGFETKPKVKKAKKKKGMLSGLGM